MAAETRQAVRLGVILPSVDSVVEAWYPRVVPDRVSVHSPRRARRRFSILRWAPGTRPATG
ncbi:MAG: hypothetical protein ACM3JG_07005 [Thiohalocapsa sp.]